MSPCDREQRRHYPTFSARGLGFCLVSLVLVAGIFAGVAVADDPALDPAEPPVRLKKKNRPAKKVEPPKDVKKGGEAKPAVPDPEKPLRPKIDDEPRDPAAKKRSDAEAECKKIVERILKNLEKAEAKLAKNDPGRTTRDIQRDILSDLDKLIEQTQSQPPPQGGGSAGKRKRSQQKAKGSSGSNDSKRNNGARDNNPNEAMKSPKKGQAGTKNGAATPKTGTTAKDDKSKLHDLFKDVWGHLPETMRQEMDAYSKARFLPDYELMLRKYYQTLSEQGRKK